MFRVPELASGSIESRAMSSDFAPSSARNTLSQGMERRRIVSWAAPNSSGDNAAGRAVLPKRGRESASRPSAVSTAERALKYARPTSAVKATASTSSTQLAQPGRAGSRR
jgi:hypothetical protein